MERSEEKKIENKRCSRRYNTVYRKGFNMAAASYKLLAELSEARNEYERINQVDIIPEPEIVNRNKTHRINKQQENDEASQRRPYSYGKYLSLVAVFIEGKSQRSRIYLQKYYGNKHICSLLD